MVSQHKKSWRTKSRCVAALASSGVFFVVLLGAGAQAATTTTTSPVHLTSSTITWVDQNVSFAAGGLKIYGTFRHPVGDPNSVPGVVLIAGSGPTDRNGNSALESGPVNTIKTLADWLSEDGVASLRYDKLGSGKTGVGHYASDPDSIGIKPFEQESAAALKYLAAQKVSTTNCWGSLATARALCSRCCWTPDTPGKSRRFTHSVYLSRCLVATSISSAFKSRPRSRPRCGLARSRRPWPRPSTQP